MKFFGFSSNKAAAGGAGQTSFSRGGSSSTMSSHAGGAGQGGMLLSSSPGGSPASSKERESVKSTANSQKSEELMPYNKPIHDHNAHLYSYNDDGAGRRSVEINAVRPESAQMGKLLSPGTGAPSAAAIVAAQGRRNSQDAFATKDQTILVFDWDDTLFPTTWVRHYMGLHWKYPLQEQPINAIQKRKIKLALDELANEVEQFLLAALQRGRVVIVTLARVPWVKLSCDNFFPRIGQLIKDHDINIVYAQEARSSSDREQDPPVNDPAAQEAFWTGKKQLAIRREVEHFYSQYPGQSWKNVISIGDSDFERKATHATMQGYSKDHDLRVSLSRGEEDVMCLSGYVGNHYRRLRTKTVKMYDSPRIKDLELEIQLLKKWLNALVALDSGLDVDLEDDERLAETHRLLTGEIL
ncbi:unnamed protein product [Amoebophrya sp. A25]|nr:unnamed protein product [Amoebophrya sp. A25]|eukprot:GSA25T00010757001.1